MVVGFGVEKSGGELQDTRPHAPERTTTIHLFSVPEFFSNFFEEVNIISFKKVIKYLCDIYVACKVGTLFR